MSFILDALKKSETDRQRQNGPALFEVKVAPPRTGLPLWAVGLGVLLAVNLIIVAWVLLRRPAQAEANGAQVGQSFQSTSGRGGPSGGGAWQGQPGQGGGQGWQGGQTTQGWQGGNGQGGGPGTQGGNGQGGGGPGAQGWQGGNGQGGGTGAQGWQGGNGQGGGTTSTQGWQGGGQGAPEQGGQPGQNGWQGGGQPQGAQAWGGQQPGQGGYPSQPGAVGPPGTVAGGPGAWQGQQGQGSGAGGTVQQAAGPGQMPGNYNGAAGASGAPGEALSADDYAPAADASPAAPFGNHVVRGTASGVPLYRDAALQPGTHIPELRLDLHVFAALPQNRFVMINMHKLHEGDSLPEGARVESITPEGAVMSANGTRFLLPRQ